MVNELEKESENCIILKAGEREFKRTKTVSRILKINQYTLKRQRKTKG